MATVTLQVEIPAPSAERLEEIYREQVAAEIARRDVWLSLKEAAAYLRMSRRNFDRMRPEWGLPVSELKGIRIVLRADLDALARAHLRNSGASSPILPFPSQQRAAA